MTRVYSIIAMFVAALMVVGFAADARAELLFSDDFNTDATPGSVNNYCLSTDLGDRLGGYLAPTLSTTAWDTTMWSYAGRVRINNDVTGAGPNVMSCEGYESYGGYPRCNGCAAIIQHDFASGAVGAKIKAAGGFVIRYDMDPMAAGSSGTRIDYGGGAFFGLANGTDSGYTSYHQGYGGNHCEVGITWGNDGKLRDARSHGSEISGLPGIVFDNTPANGNWGEWYTFEMRVTVDPTDGFSEGADSEVTYWWGAQGTASGSLTQIDINPGDPSSMSFSFEWDADGTNYLGVAGYLNDNNYTLFDNMEVHTIPEPGTFALLATGLIGLLAYAWRRRK